MSDQLNTLATGHFTPRDRDPSIHWLQDKVGARAKQDALEKKSRASSRKQPTFP